MTTGEKRTGHKWTPPADYNYDKMPALRLQDGTYVCARPPTGWDCTREPGHEGPCAAVPTPNVSLKPTVHHFEKDCPHTDLQPVGFLSKEQREAAHQWMKEHDKARHIRPGKTYRYSGAIGGAYTWQFTGTSIGQVVTVKCSCGEVYDVSDYDNLW